MRLVQVFVENVEDVTCECGNQPHADGFYPCNSVGVHQHDEMGNPSDDWTGEFHYCQSCERMILVVQS